MKRINDIFYSLQGEGRNTGRAAIFIRFAGCNLHCSFCDTQFNEYREMTDEQIKCSYITLIYRTFAYMKPTIHIFLLALCVLALALAIFFSIYSASI